MSFRMIPTIVTIIIRRPNITEPVRLLLLGIIHVNSSESSVFGKSLRKKMRKGSSFFNLYGLTVTILRKQKTPAANNANRISALINIFKYLSANQLQLPEVDNLISDTVNQQYFESKDITLSRMKKIDNHILELLCNGNHQAFDDVYIAYYNKIKNFINGLIKSDYEAEELTQDIFMKLWINRETIDPNKSFNSYMYTIARNTAFNYLKHKIVETTYEYNHSIPEGIEETEEIIFANEIKLLIDLTIEKMPEKRKQIFKLSRNEGFTNQEIAEKLNLSKKTVENQISLALKELRSIISCFLLFFL